MTQETLLQTIIQTMKGGVVACDAEQHITLFNRAAQNLLNQNKSLKPGAPLYSLFPAGPIKHALDLIRYRHSFEDKPEYGQQYIQFMNSTCDQSRFFQCRLCFMQTASPKDGSFVVIFEDAGSWYRPGNRLYLQTEELRGPIANLRAAVENITEHPEMPPVMRSAFENVLVQESLNLSNSFDTLADNCHSLMQSQSQLVAMQSSFFFGYLQDHLTKKGMTATGTADCSHVIKIDSHGLLLVVDFLVDKLLKNGKGDSLLCETNCGEHFAYIDLIWAGEPLATADIETWLDEILQDSIGRITVADVLQGQGGDIWSQPHNKPGFSMVRLAMSTET
jgi:signal transduction histidine kinase